MDNPNLFGDHGMWNHRIEQYVWLVRLFQWRDPARVPHSPDAACYLCGQPAVARYTPYGLPNQMFYIAEDGESLSAFLARDPAYRADVTTEQCREHLGWLGPYPICRDDATEAVRACVVSWAQLGVPVHGEMVIAPGTYTALVVCVERGPDRRAGCLVLNREGFPDPVALVRELVAQPFTLGADGG